MRIAERDAEFRDFYGREFARLRALATMMTGDPDKSFDIAQDALVRAYVSWGRIRSGDPGPYVRRALVNQCRNHLRRRSLEARKKPAPDRSDARDHGGRVDEALRVAHALTSLSPIRRATLVLRYYEDMTEAEIARVLERPVGTVKSDIKRSLERLRPLLEERVGMEAT